MRFRGSGLLLLLAFLMVSLATDAAAGRLVRVFGGQPENKSDEKKPGAKDKDKEKPFKEMIKDKVAIEGLFTFYLDTADNSLLMAIKPEQFGPIFLCNETRSQSEGTFFDNGSMGNSFPFYFKKVGKSVMLMEKNLRLRADTSSTMYRAVEHGISDALFASTEVKSLPQDSTKAILVDPAAFFVRDAENIGYFLGQRAKLGMSFDKNNSYFELVKSFPQNSEIDVKLHYRTSQPLSGTTMQNPYSMFHTYHYSLSTLPETDYVPRIADDRVGHFLTIYQDYTNLDTETPYVRFVERWNLKKKDPSAPLSEPVEPIVFWVENTVPLEYRDAIAEGVEFWNKSYEKIGFKNAIQAKQMPDTADWDPADVRYNTVRWIVIPGGGYAVGPSRANPFTGQIYDADIRVSSDFVRYMFNNMEMFIGPLSFEGQSLEEKDNQLIDLQQNPHFCNYGAESAKEAGFGLAYVLAINTLSNKDSLTKEYVHSYLVELIAHEVGHTLGFRHNFKASSVYTLDQVSDRAFTKQHGITGTVMDYGPPNIAGPTKTQGEFYSSAPGPYDDWAIEYAYSDLGASSPYDELPQLKKIASRAPEAGLAYGTDEDAFGSSTKSIDPYCNLFDLGDDPLRYCEHRIYLTNELWRNAIKQFEVDGNSYQKMLNVFQSGWRSYYESAAFAAKFIGGIRHHRDHVGDPNGRVPFEPVSAADQRKAMNIISEKFFAPDAFDLPETLWNKLQPERFPDFNWSVYSVPQIDYPIHQQILNVQNQVLAALYGPYVLGRLLNNLERYPEEAERYTMYNLFSDVRNSIWTELNRPSNVNSFRRQLQLSHLNRLVAIYLSSTATFPHDALTLAANDLETIETSAKRAVQSSAINDMTRAHINEVLRQISAAKGAKREFSTLAR